MTGRQFGWLRPLGWAFAGAVGLRNHLYDAGWMRTTRLTVPVVSVGNLTVGGTGKTPLVALLAARLAEAGRRPAVVSRGHAGRNARRTDGGPLTVSTGDGSGARVSTREAGDEPVLLASLLPSIPVVVGRDRVAAARMARERCNADLIVLDDGFQHRRLYRDADLVTMDAGTHLEHEPLLPAGTRREPVRGLRRAHAVIVTRADRDDLFEQQLRWLQTVAPDVPVFRARHHPVGLRLLSPAGGSRPLAALRDLPVSAFAGLATPRVLERTLEELGARVVRFDERPDHHAFLPGEIGGLIDSGRRAGAELAVTTAKDAVRVPAGETVEGLVVLDIAVQIDRCAELVEHVQALCNPAGGNR